MVLFLLVCVSIVLAMVMKLNKLQAKKMTKKDDGGGDSYYGCHV